jgi:protoheme IX farnesyltransferase
VTLPATDSPTRRRSWFDQPLGTRNRFVDLLAGTALVIYAVIATGAAAASTTGEWHALVSRSTLFVVGHALLTGLAGIMLFLSLVAAWRVEVDRLTRLVVTSGAALFPLQVALGALLASGYGTVPSQLHLLVAAAIFVTLLVALGWTLEGRPGETRRGTETDRMNVADSPADQPSGGDAELEPSEKGASQQTGFVATARAYLELTKPRLMWLLCLLALAGMALAATTGTTPDGVTVVATLAGGVLAIGASGTFNHVAERDRDRQMDRTSDRPIATDQIPKRNATAFGLALVALSMVVMVALVNAVAAALTLVAIGYYSVVYTVVLKPNTTWNIAIGGGAGALPAVIGWAAVTGSVGVPALVLAALVVVWTPAHFYNLAIVYRDDYARAGYPMYPVVSGVPAARRRILAMLGATLLVTALLLYLTPLGWLFALATVGVGGVFLWALVTQCRVRTDDATMRTFHASNAYLGVVLLAIVLEAVLLV